jgi:flagella basal body P-ring formation protein FlgA
MKIRFLILLFSMLLPAWPVIGEEVQGIETIQKLVEEFLLDETVTTSGQVSVQSGRIDSRLRLPACAEMEAYWPDGARQLGNVTVGVRCHGPSSWSLFVRARVEVLAQIMVSSRPLSRGAVLGAADFDISTQDITRLGSGYFTDPQQLSGAVMTRAVRAGTVLTPAMVRAALAVRRGERVSILAVAGGLQVRMEGEALSDGAPGELIRVRNLSSRQEIEAEVIGPGQVQVRM